MKSISTEFFCPQTHEQITQVSACCRLRLGRSQANWVDDSHVSWILPRRHNLTLRQYSGKVGIWAITLFCMSILSSAGTIWKILFNSMICGNDSKMSYALSSIACMHKMNIKFLYNCQMYSCIVSSTYNFQWLSDVSFCKFWLMSPDKYVELFICNIS